jgi:hypothetical protein
VAQAQGRVTGRVLDRASGRPIPTARVLVVGQPAAMETDLDGRYRSGLLPVGTYSIRAAMVGYKPVQQDSITVVAGQATVRDFALTPSPIEIQEIVVQTAKEAKASSDAGLLSIQQDAPGVTDGISAQAIARSPDANAGEAMKRVTGVTLLDGKFLVVRGLGERYSNALLNGAEMPNPVVEKKIAPLDLFPAGLLQSVVATKTATPDKPGDFAGGSVELTTKDFPDNRVLQLSVTQSANDNITFQRVALAPQSGRDWLGIDNGRRQAPYIPFVDPGVLGQQRVLQSFQNNIWNPAPRRIGPGLGLGLTYGDQLQGEHSALGFVGSLTYERKASYTPNRIYNLYYLGQEGTSSVNWGGIFNVTLKLGGSTKIGLRNLYTRSADETTRSASGSETGSNLFEQTYQVRYVERILWQSQLAGEHRLGFLWGSGLQWKGTFGRAHISDPDNHSAKYTTDLESGAVPGVGAKRLIRDLSDRTWSTQADLSIPVSLRRQGDALLKTGGYYRAKTRAYEARDVLINRADFAGQTGLDGLIGTLPPDQVFAPENMGTYFSYISSSNHNDPYFANDNITAAYGMVDLPLLSRLRLVGGLRLEHWALTLKPGGNDPEGDFLKYDSTIVRPDSLVPRWDKLWSANLTYALNDRMNFRLAGYRTLARPDSREISPGQYSPIGGIGACTEVGNRALERSLITNGDARWEFYPRPGELFAVSGFYKTFDKPIIEIRTVGGVANAGATCTIANAAVGHVGGIELEMRRGLDFLPGALRHLSLGLNFTGVGSSIAFPARLGIQSREFIGQSPYVINGILAYDSPGGGLSFSVLYNYFADRTTKYSNVQPQNAPPVPNPNWVERGRSVLDAKAKIGITSHLRLSLSGRNLTRAPILIGEDAGARRLVERYNPGVSVSTSLTYDF